MPFPIAWGVGGAIFPVFGVAMWLGSVSEKRRKKRAEEEAREIGLDVALHNWRHMEQSCFQVTEGDGYYAKIERRTGKVLDRRATKGPYATVPIENFYPERGDPPSHIYCYDPHQDRYLKVRRHDGKILSD